MRKISGKIFRFIKDNIINNKSIIITKISIKFLIIFLEEEMYYIRIIHLLYLFNYDLVTKYASSQSLLMFSSIVQTLNKICYPLKKLFIS